MAITSAVHSGPYVGTGAQTAFPFSFTAIKAGDVLVKVDGVEISSGAYTVTLASDFNSGTVTFTTAPAVDASVVIEQNPDFLQDSQFANQAAYGMSSVNQINRRATQRSNWLYRRMAALFSSTMLTAADRAGKYLGWDLSGNPVLSAGTGSADPAFLASAAAIAASSLDTAIGAVRVGGYTTFGDGGDGLWIADSTANSALAAANPRACKVDAAGRYWRVLPGIDGLSVRAVGAAGDAVADDTAAFVSALATGFDVAVPTGSYKFTADLTISTNYQRFGGPGVLVPAGNCGIIVGGGCTGVEVDLTFNSSGHTGTALKVDNANRVRIKKLHGIDVYNALYVRKANSVTLEWMWATCRGYGITWYGDASNRSDILTIINATLSVTSGNYGLDWNGDCHSLEVNHLGIVCGSSVSAGNGYGVIIRNTTGGSDPAIARFNHVEVDYSGTHAVDIQAGSDYDIALPYLLGASGSGIKVGAAINARQVRVGGGKSNGNTRYGIENLGGAVLLAGNTEFTSNTLGQTTGDVRTESPRYHVDATGYWYMNGTNPYFVWDSTGFTAFDRSGLTLIDSIGGAILARDPNRITAYKPLKLASYTVATLPSGQDGDQAMVTDANATTYMSAVAGGGANKVRVTYLGGWKIA